MEIFDYTLKRDSILCPIIKKNTSHLSDLLFQEHTHTQCIFKVPWTMKLSSTKTVNSKREGAERILEEVWSTASIIVLLSHAGLETYLMASNAVTLRTQNNCCMTSKHRESYREEPTALHTFESRYFDDRLRGAASSQTHLYISPSVGIKKRLLLPTTSSEK